MPLWEVDLYVDGPVTVRERIKTTQQKGFLENDPFYSDIEIVRNPSGIKATVTARAPAQEIAYKAALFFFGGTVDVLTLSINSPMNLSFTERARTVAQHHDVRQIIERIQFEESFREARLLRANHPVFLRSLGWYRKGLTTDDPLDKFLAFWNAIEIVAGRYYRSVPSSDYERASRGSKNQVWSCFEALWGTCNVWPIITGQSDWIDENYDVRIGVAHGVAPIDVHKVAEVAQRLPAIKDISYKFLSGWRDKFLDINQQQPPVPPSVAAQELPPG
jgi:hypothetical protein